MTAVILFLGVFKFQNCIGRLVESCKDFGISVAYAFCDLLDLDFEITPTVNNYPNYDYLNLKTWFYSLFKPSETPSVNNPSVFIPSEWESFKIKWALYWQAFATRKAFYKYLYYVITLLCWLSTFLMFVVPIGFIGFKIFKKLYFKPKVEEEIKQSKPLKLWRVFTNSRFSCCRLDKRFDLLYKGT